MNIGSLIQNYEYKNNASMEKNAETKYVETYKKAAKKRDSIEISSEAYEIQNNTENMSATSGKDTLGITKGTSNNTYVIHFSDSAMVSRAISRGYITVNGITIALSDEVKKQLIETDKQAETDRMQAYNEYVMQHEMAVAQQQSETLQKAAQDASKALQIAAKLSSGKKITSAEAQILMKFSPQLYALAMSTASKSEQNVKQESSHMNKNNTNPNSETPVQGVEWSQFEWKTYESQMTVSLENGADIQGVSEGKNILNEGTKVQ